MKLAYNASDIIEANIVAGLLRSNGIEAHVGGFYLQGGVGELAAQGFANVHVADEDVELAKTIIAEYDKQPANVKVNAKKRSDTKYFLNVVLFILVFIIVFYYLVIS